MNDEEREPIKLGYWVDLKGAEFSDTSWIQAVPVGTYQHPVYGEISFTPDKISNMALNVKNEVRDTQLDVDYDHKSRTGKAAGWITDAQARPDGLYLQVEWTETATAAIKNKEYKYFSPEYQDKWKHPKTGTMYRDVLFGGALTNRPFLKDLLPVNLSELIGDQGEPIMADDTFVASMRDILGLDGEASEEAVLSTAEQLIVAQNETEAVSSEVPESSPDSIPELVAASEETTEMVALTETYPEVKALVDRVALLEVANKLSEVNLQMSEWDSSRPYTIPSVLRDRARKLLSEARNTELVQFIDELTKVGMVTLGETESATRGMDKSATDTFMQMVDKKLSEDSNTDYVDAVSDISRDNPELFEEYRREAFQEVN
jgi:phage I-like protein